MRLIRDEVRSGKKLFGTWCNLGSSLTVEMAGTAGLDWVLIDLEHGAGTFSELRYQLQGATAGQITPIVRLPWNELPYFKSALDLGAAGVMVPYVNTPEEAALAVSRMRYPPAGTRGVAKLNRASAFGSNFESYFADANSSLLCVVQIETSDAVASARAIAEVDGVDVLFIGPLDLSVNMRTQPDLDTPPFSDAMVAVVSAAREAGKAAGILLASETQIPRALELGFTFVALGSDGSMVLNGMTAVARAFKGFTIT